MLPLFFAFFKPSQAYRTVTTRKRSSRLFLGMKPYVKKTKNPRTKKFRFLSLFALTMKQRLTRPTKASPFKQTLSFFSLFSKIQFSLNPLVHPFTGTRLHMNAVELKWKKSWDNFIRSFFAKRAKRWYRWEHKARKKNVLYKTLGSSLRDLALFLKKSRIKKLKRWERKQRQASPKYVVEKPDKPFFLNHLFYAYRMRLTYRRLRFIAKHFRSQYPKHLTKFKFKTPYFFLHQPFDLIRSVVPLVSSVVAGFRKSKTTYKTFKRLNWRKKNKAFMRIKCASQRFTFTRLFRRKIKKVNHLSKFKLRALPLLAISKVLYLPHWFELELFSQVKKHHPFFWDGKGGFCEPLKRRLKLTITRWRKKRYHYRYKLREWSQVLRFVNRRYRRKVSASFSHIRQSTLAYITSRLIPTPTLYTRFRSKFYQSILTKYSFQTLLPKLVKAINLKLRGFLSNTFDIDQPQAKRKLFIYPEFGLVFVLPFLGFLLLSHTRPFNYFGSHSWGLHRFRKLKYSFAIRNELPKHVLRKYAHAKLSLEHFLQSRLSQKLTHSIQPAAANATFKGYEENWADSFFSNSSLASTFIYPFTDISSPLLNKFEYKFLDKSYRPLYTIYTTRFKPGYMRLWRRARTSLQVRTKTFFRYQHQLTDYLLMFKRGVHLNTTATDEFKIQNLIMKTRFVLDKNSAKLFILRKLVFVNGVLCTNPRFHLFAGDFLQLIVSFKYYITFRWLLNHNQKIKIRIKNLSKKLKVKKAARNPDKKYTKNTPQWVSRYTSLFLDIAKYLEVDFFTLSAFVLHDPLSWNDINVYAETILKPQIFNMYNWKYIN